MSASAPGPASEFARRAAALDAADPLARFRTEFPAAAASIYLDGNSLGLLSTRAEASLQRVLDEWRTLGIAGWTDARPPWHALSESIAASLAPLLGAAPDQVLVTGSTTTNLHQLLATLFAPTSSRQVILADELGFASDVHAIASHLRLRGLDPARHLRKVPSRDGRTLAEEDILAALAAPDVAVAVLPAVIYTSGQWLDLPRLSREARRHGVLIGWDCSHSVGAVPHALDEAGADFAFWCSYKYLNAGPGAVAGLYLHRRHHARPPGLAGWWGVRPDRRFALRHDHEPATGAAALHIGTPHILGLAPLQGALEPFAAAGGIAPLRAKSVAQTGFLLELADALLAPLGVGVATPREEHRRGGHVALTHPQAWQLCQALRAGGVVADCRRPDILRLAPAPLYNTFADCAGAISHLERILRTRAHTRFPSAPALVT